MVAQIKETPAATDWSKGAAIVEDAVVPVAEARLPLTDWGFTRSDVTYDVVHVWKGAFFRLEDHLDRFLASVGGLRLELPMDRAALREALTALVRRTGLRDAYVSMICTRGSPAPGMPRHPRHCVNRFYAYAVPFVWVIPEDVQARGAHAIVARTPRIAPESVDPTIKNFHWGDLTRALFEASDAGADTAILLDGHDHVTEGPGFNVFAVIDGTVISPDRGALEGITRKSVLELCQELGVPARVRPLHVEELRAADEIFTATTAGGVMPVARLDGRILGNDRPGPISMRLRQRYWEKHDEGWHATPIPYD
ncbi:MAG: aminotransferase class IV [Alphaproteobacteria bacterium]|nr:aminotransferase class IV [Alphaproteobacteria bacterium]